MKVDEILAGPRLNALVGEKVMGLHVEWKECIHIPGHGTGTAPYYYEGIIQRKENEWQNEEMWEAVPHYSDNISAAWEVVEKLVDMGYVVSVGWGPDYEGTNYASIQMILSCHLAADLILNNQREMDGIGETVPLAICRAALKAAGIEENDD